MREYNAEHYNRNKKVVGLEDLSKHDIISYSNLYIF